MMIGAGFGLLAGSGNSASWATWIGANDGSAVQFETGTATSTTYITACKVDANKTLVLYRYNSTVYARIITTSGNTVSAIGSAATVASLGTTGLTCCTLDSGRVLAAYLDGSAHLIAVVLSISGTTVTVNSPTTIEGGVTVTDPFVTLLTTDKCVISYADATNSVGKARCFTISTTTVSAPGSAVQFVGSGVGSLSMATLTSTTAIIGYAVFSSTIRAIVITNTTGTTLTAGTQLNFGSGNDANNVAIASLSATSAIVIANDDSGVKGSAYALSISGTTITNGSRLEFEAGSVAINASDTGYGVAAIDSATAIGIYVRSGVTYGLVFTVSGTTVTKSTRVSKNAAFSGYNVPILLDATRVLALYYDGNSSDRGTSVVLSL